MRLGRQSFTFRQFIPAPTGQLRLRAHERSRTSTTFRSQRPQRCAATITPRVHVYLVEGFEPSCGATHTCSLPFIGVSFTGLEPATPRLDTARREEDSNPSRFPDRSAFKAVPITIRD